MNGAAKPGTVEIPISSWSERRFTITPIIARSPLEGLVFPTRKSRLPNRPLLPQVNPLILSNSDSSRAK
jgi:hypothetical protein